MIYMLIKQNLSKKIFQRILMSLLQWSLVHLKLGLINSMYWWPERWKLRHLFDWNQRMLWIMQKNMQEKGSKTWMTTQEKGSTIWSLKVLKKVGDTTNLQMLCKEIMHFHHTEPDWLHPMRFEMLILYEKTGNLPDTGVNLAKHDGNTGSHTKMTGQQIDVWKMMRMDGSLMIKSIHHDTCIPQGFHDADAMRNTDFLIRTNKNKKTL